MIKCNYCLKYFHKDLIEQFPNDRVKQEEIVKKKPYMGKSCIKRHICAGLFTNYFERNKQEYEEEMARDYDGFEGDYHIDDAKSEHYY